MSILLTAVLSISVNAKADGPSGSGGGDSLICKGNKYFSYDYVLTDDGDQKINPVFLKAKSAKDILKSIAKVLESKLPMIAEDLNDFISALSNTNIFDTNEKRVWSFGLNPLDDLKDESKLRIPVDCRNKDGSINIVQAVIRRETESRIEYNGDSTILKKLAQNSPLQLSFLYIHEWLRDYSTDPTVIMKINRILHEKEWIDATPETMQKVFLGIGMTLEKPSKILNIKSSSTQNISSSPNFKNFYGRNGRNVTLFSICYDYEDAKRIAEEDALRQCYKDEGNYTTCSVLHSSARQGNIGCSATATVRGEK